MSFSSEEESYSEPQPEGMSSTSKILLVLTGVFGICVLACCGGVYFIFNKAKMEESSDPADVIATQQAILPATIPERFEPVQSVSMNMVVAEIEMASFQAKAPEQSEMAFMRMGFPMGGMDQAQAEAQLDQQDFADVELENETIEEKTYQVDGREIKVLISHGTPTQNGPPTTQELPAPESVESEEAEPSDTEETEKTDTNEATEETEGNEPSEETAEDSTAPTWFSVRMTLMSEGGMLSFSLYGPEEEFDQAEIDALIKSFQFKQD